MSRLAVLLGPLAMLTGCFYPVYYPDAPRYDYGYVASPDAPARAYFEPTEPVAAPEPPPPPPPAAAAVSEAPPIENDATIVKLRRERDAAQKALDDYADECRRRRSAPVARPPRPVPNADTPARGVTDLGLSLGARALYDPIDDSSVMATFGLGVTHWFAGSSAALDLGLGYAGFVETDASADRYFSTFEGSAGLRFKIASIDNGRSRGGRAFYIGGGVMLLEADDTFEPFAGGTVSDYDSATGTYGCVGVHLGDGRGTGSCDFELRQVSGTSYSTFGTERSSDGIDFLLRLSMSF